jgi:hypothetical protein
MNDLLILTAVGLGLFVLGLLLLKRENRLFKDAVTAAAKVVGYYESRSEHNLTMYTMEVEYRLGDGTLIHTREQSSSNRKKYQVGTELDVCYSKEKPDFFVVSGDKSRIFIFYGMIIVGLATMALFGYMYLNGGEL